MNEFETRAADWLSYPSAIERILGHAAPLSTELLPFTQAMGRALGSDLLAPRTLPEHDNSAMDGYAVLARDIGGASADAPVTLAVVGQSLPGAPWPGTVGHGQAVRIMTGAAVPEGVDSVVRVEHTNSGDGPTVEIRTATDALHNIRPAGEDMSAGDVVAAKGTTLSPGHVAVLTSTGHIVVPVGRTPRVALLSTGDELVSVAALREVIGDEPALDVLWANRIVDSNTPTLEACVRDAGGTPTAIGIARDRKDSIHEQLDRVGDADLLVTTGGASMGTHDLLKRVMDERGFRQEFWRVRIRPGSPVSLGFLPREDSTPVPVFGLPGNPASAFVTFELFVRPYIRALAGHSKVHRPLIRAVAGESMRAPKDLTVFLRVTLSGEGAVPTANLTGPQGSGLVSSLGLADGLAQINEGTDVIARGESVDVVRLRAP